jgi:Mrp family chromosome partitioning ATPase
VADSKEKSAQREASGSDRKREALVRTIKVVEFRSEYRSAGQQRFDKTYIDSRMYNSFNFPVFGKDEGTLGGVLGITSARAGEGKTTVAANLAIALTFKTECDVVLVDCNFRRPKLEAIFGVGLVPGLVDAFTDTSIVAHRTDFEGLTVVTVGEIRKLLPETPPEAVPAPPPASEEAPDAVAPEPPDKSAEPLDGVENSIVLPYMYGLRDVLYSLAERFDYVILDLPPVSDSLFPTLSLQYMRGIIAVVDASHTKRDDVDKMITRMGDERLMGFVLNKSSAVL